MHLTQTHLQPLEHICTHAPKLCKQLLCPCVCACVRAVTNVSSPARIAFPGCVNWTFPAGAAAARHPGLWNGLSNLGRPDMTATQHRLNLAPFFSSAVCFARVSGRREPGCRVAAPRAAQPMPRTSTVGL